MQASPAVITCGQHMRDKQTIEPFKALGEGLRSLRVKAHETLAETSGAVEINAKQLSSYEFGRICPDEEVLLMLISHFSPPDEEAIRLWKLAGYGATEIDLGQDDSSGDTPVLFTDLAEITANQYGLVVDFKQGGGINKSAKSIARLGMSREHAENIIRTLAIVLAKTSAANNSKLLSRGTDTGVDKSSQVS